MAEHLPLHKDDAVLIFSRENEEGSRYGVQLLMPDRPEDVSLMPYEQLMGALAMFIKEPANVDIIMRHFNKLVEEQEQNGSETESD